ncbi:hypothetical protein OIB37_00660 [Streptomyces sp. NBC_00820]|nr:hypothetical protein OIB37_00660 [Streptomyces sp. NBC_00820]
MDALIAEASLRRQLGMVLISVNSTIVRAHHESAGLTVAKGPWTPFSRP